MRAMVYEEYGSPDVLHLAEVEIPTPKDNEVLVKVHAASLNYGDLPVLRGAKLQRLMSGGFRKPKNKVLGDDIAGEVVEVGKNVTQYQPGDEVFGISIFGAFAQYACAKEKLLVMKPAKMSFEQAAAVPSAFITALNGLRDKGQIQQDQKVLIAGASGGVGTFAVQLAKSYGAEVTGVCSTRKLEMVCKLGADQVIDYTQEDFTKNGQQYDLILALGGNRPLGEYKRALGPEGIYVCAGGSGRQYFEALLLGPFYALGSGQKLGAMYGNPTQEDYLFFIELFEANKVVPVIDRCYPLNELPEAMKYFEAGNAQGKVVITIAHDNAPTRSRIS